MKIRSFLAPVLRKLGARFSKQLGLIVMASGLAIPATAYGIATLPLADGGFEDYEINASVGYAYANEYRPTSAWVGNPDDAPGPVDGGPDASNWIYDANYAETGSVLRKRAAPTGGGDQALHGRSHYSGQEAGFVFEPGRTYTFSIWAQGDDDTEFAGAFGWQSTVWMYLYNGSLPFTGVEEDALAFGSFAPPTPVDENGTVDVNSTMFTPGDFYNRDVNWTQEESQNNWRKISISWTVDSNLSPEAGQPIGVALRLFDDAGADRATLTASSVPEDLRLLVHPLTGAMKLESTLGSNGVELNYYEILSDADSLDASPEKWNSLSDQGVDPVGDGNETGQTWDEGGGSGAGVLTEAFWLGSTTLAPGESRTLGNPYNTSIGAQDLLFRYGVPGEEVSHVAPVYYVVPGDMDDDGDVDEEDVPLFIKALVNRAAYEAQYPLVNVDFSGDVDGNGVFDFGDVAAFSALFEEASATASSSGVPEPSSFVLLVAVALGALGIRNRRLIQ